MSPCTIVSDERLVISSYCLRSACEATSMTPTNRARTGRAVEAGGRLADEHELRLTSVAERSYLRPMQLDTTRSEATRFLQRATFGPRPEDVDEMQRTGQGAWFETQLETAAVGTHLQRRIEYGDTTRSIWEAYLSAPDQLRKRVAFALSQIFVVSSDVVGNERIAAYVDLLESQCFGTYRQLLEAVTRSQAMGQYLTYESNQRADPERGTVPDENYAREIMQLFSIGLWELNPDGTQRLDADGAPIPTYDISDIEGLARVFTGFEMPYGDLADFANPMRADGGFSEFWHERGEKRFLGSTIQASSTRTLDESVNAALDVIAAHPNVGPFIGSQLIQRLVTSNPSPAYVQRVAAVFADDGAGVRGNLREVVRAILFDPEAATATPAPGFGKIREPVLRFTTLARALRISSSGRPWPIYSLADHATALGQQPFGARSVFNFFRPGYLPPRTALADAGLVSPEMQITDETTTVGWINFLQGFLLRPPRDGDRAIEFDIDDLIDLVPDATISQGQAASLVDEIITRLCPFGVDDGTRNLVVNAVKNAATPNGVGTLQRERVMGAAVLIAATTDFIYDR